jgi:hypothetical protein
MTVRENMQELSHRIVIQVKADGWSDTCTDKLWWGAISNGSNGTMVA